MIVQERYHGKPIAANGTFTLTGQSIGGFLCTTAGTLTAAYASGTVLINALPVTAGVYYPLPFLMNPGSTVTLAGGAAGALAVE